MGKRVRVKAPATIGNVGPGFDVLGLAISGLCDTIEMELTGTTTIVDVTGRDANLLPRDPTRNSATIAADFLARSLNHPTGFKVSLHRQLPSSGGLGASAAGAVAGALGAAVLLGVEKNIDRVIAAALAGEAAVAGRHLDNIAPCLRGGLTICLSVDPPKFASVPIVGLWFIAVATPAQKLSTRESRKVLPASLPQSDWVRQSALTAALVNAFCTGSAKLMRDALHDPYAEPLRGPLIANFVTAKKAALENGALGCSISGAGPTAFAICESLEAAQHCANAMAQNFGPGAIPHAAAINTEGATWEWV